MTGDTVPGYCQVCELSKQFGSQIERNIWERDHEHGGSD